MIRIVLVGWSDNDWRLYRQSLWIGQVRRQPQAARWPRHHFDIDEASYSSCLDGWERSGANASRQAALDRLAEYGAVEIPAS